MKDSAMTAPDGVSDLVEIDAHEVIPGLWMGSAPPPGSAVADAGFSVLVLCARRFQRPAEDFPGVLRVIHAPNDDCADPAEADLRAARRAAKEVARNLKAGRKVLVTCMGGINRSGLVVALAIHERLGYSGKACIELVRGKRRVGSIMQALCNRAFVRHLEGIASR